MYKNAGIKSYGEAATRLENGEVLYNKHGDRIFFDSTYKSPFRIGWGAINQELGMFWSTFKEWEIKVDWKENIGDGLLCWVWDNYENTKHPELVISYKAKSILPYKVSGNPVYKNAEPMTREEVEKYILDQ